LEAENSIYVKFLSCISFFGFFRCPLDISQGNVCRTAKTDLSLFMDCNPMKFAAAPGSAEVVT